MSEPKQVRHKEYGLFQGDFMGLAFWHPMSEMPEQGIFKFDGQTEAEWFVEMLGGLVGTNPLYASDNFIIEPFDVALDAQLTNTSAATHSGDTGVVATQSGEYAPSPENSVSGVWDSGANGGPQ